jgi:hypothetical protein
MRSSAGTTVSTNLYSTLARARAQTHRYLLIVHGFYQSARERIGVERSRSLTNGVALGFCVVGLHTSADRTVLSVCFWFMKEYVLLGYLRVMLRS